MSQNSDASGRRRGIAHTSFFILGALFLIFGVSGVSSATQYWEGWLQSGDMASDASSIYLDSSVQSNKATDGLQDLALSAVVEGITPPTDVNGYYSIRIATSAFASALPGAGYTMGSIVSASMPSFHDEFPSFTLGDNQGVMKKLPVDSEGRQLYFNYWGKYYDRVFISVNGFIAFGVGNLQLDVPTVPENATFSGPTFQYFPDPSFPNGVIAPYWHDFAPASDSRIRWGNLGGWGSSHKEVMIMWENFDSNKGVNDVFCVNFVCDPSAYGPADIGDSDEPQTIEFHWQTINLDFQVKGGRYKPLFQIGLENQMGTKGLTVDYGDVTAVLSGKKVRFEPLLANQNSVTKITVAATTSGSAGYPDPWSYVKVRGQQERQLPDGSKIQLWGGHNVELQDNQEGSYNFFTDPYTQLAVGTVLTCVGFFVPPPGVWPLLLGVAGAAYGFGGIAMNLAYTDPTSMDLPPEGTQDPDLPNYAYAWSTAHDEVVGVLGLEDTSDTMINPVLEWQICTKSPLTGQSFLDSDHSLDITVFSEVLQRDDDWTNDPYLPRLTAGIQIRMGPHMTVNQFSDKSPNQYDHFNDGILTDTNNPWDATGRSGNGIIEISKSLKTPANVLYSDFNDLQTNGWVVPQPYEKAGYCGLDTTQGYLPTANGVRSSLKVAKTQTIGTSWAKREFKQANWDFVTADFKIRLDNSCSKPVDYSYIMLRQGDTPRIKIMFYESRISAVGPSDTKNDLASFSVNTWYAISIKAWIKDKKFDVYVNGVKKNSQPISFCGDTSGGAFLDNMYVQTANVDVGSGTMWVDDIEIASEMSLHVKGATAADKARAKYKFYPMSSGETLDPSTRYAIAFDFFIPSTSKSTYVVLIDDTRVELVWKQNKNIYAIGSNGAETLVGGASMDVWNRLNIIVDPPSGKFYVSINYVGNGDVEDRGPFNMKPGYTGTEYAMYFGSRVTPDKRDLFDAYWDRVTLAVYCAN